MVHQYVPKTGPVPTEQQLDCCQPGFHLKTQLQPLLAQLPGFDLRFSRVRPRSRPLLASLGLPWLVRPPLLFGSPLPPTTEPLFHKNPLTLILCLDHLPNPGASVKSIKISCNLSVQFRKYQPSAYLCRASISPVPPLQWTPHCRGCTPPVSLQLPEKQTRIQHQHNKCDM